MFKFYCLNINIKKKFQSSVEMCVLYILQLFDIFSRSAIGLRKQLWMTHENKRNLFSITKKDQNTHVALA